MNKSSEEQQKQRYEKPAVKRFPLRPEEAVLGHCKTSTGGLPSSNGACHGIFCKTVGS